MTESRRCGIHHVRHGKIGDYYFLDMAIRELGIVETICGCMARGQWNTVVVYSMDSGSISSGVSYEMRKAGIEHRHFGNRIQTDLRNLAVLVETFLEGEPGGMEFSVFGRIGSLDLESITLKDDSLFRTGFLQQHRIAKRYEEYLTQFRPELHFLDRWDRQQLLTGQKKVYSSIVQSITVQ